MEVLRLITERFLRFFYAVSPRSSSFETIEKVPRYVNEAVPFFVSLIVLEWTILYFKRGRKLPPINDGLTSMAHGTFLEIGRILFRGVETAAYVYTYQNYHIYELSWNSSLTWFIAAVGVDFCYYWAHRAVHEINLFWSQHQVHHSSEEYNLTTALRQGIIQRWFVVCFYLPMALFIPPSHFFVHIQLNQLYQFWIHTELIDTLGPLEKILNTPSHHRVHHGSNKYCVDKNYGGVFIVWDKLFGTFAVERKDEKPIYGLIEQVNSFNPLYLQFFYLQKVRDKFRSVSGSWNKISAVIKGPGWSPGTPWTGHEHLLPDLKERDKYRQPLSASLTVFMVIHSAIISASYVLLSVTKTLPASAVWTYCLYILASLASIGGVFDNRPWSALSEFLRCAAFVVFVPTSGPMILLNFLKAFFAVSAVYWLWRATDYFRATKTRTE